MSPCFEKFDPRLMRPHGGPQAGARGTLVDQWTVSIDTEGRITGPEPTGLLTFRPDLPPRFWIRYAILRPYRVEGIYRGDDPHGGPYSDRGEAEEVAVWLNHHTGLVAFNYVTDRSPLDV